jgi:virginiamycin A acetyltransferase
MTTAHDPWRADAVEVANQAARRSVCWGAPALNALYRLRRFRKLVRRLCLRLEGGGIHSQTWRRILANYHDVTVGRYSYGDILEQGVLPPGTVVGAYCSVGAGLIVRRRDHPVARPYMHPFFYNSALGLLRQDTIPTESANPLTIGHDVWIGDRVTILGGCRTIGNGSVIAAGAVVTHDVAPYMIVGGVPARLIRARFSPARAAEIEASAWWDRDIASIIAAPPVSGNFVSG